MVAIARVAPDVGGSSDREDRWRTPHYAVRVEVEPTMTTAPETPARPSLPHRVARVWADEYDTLMNWPAGRRHLISRAIIITIVDTIALLLVAALLPGIRLDGNLPEV